MKIQNQFTYSKDMVCRTSATDGRATLTIAPAMRPNASEATWSPMDLLAVAHGTCMAMMMGKAAKAKDLDIDGMKVEISLEMADCMPPQITAVNARFILPRKFSADQLAVLKAGAEMCPVHKALRPEIAVTLELIVPE
ncbi:MAG: OsmC family protein [Phycisphaerales bacterium]|nr:OsmC family protein [Phycisphaerales bacterium]